MHVQIPTFFPFTVQVYLSGHGRLVRKPDKRGIAYCKLENAFVWIDTLRRTHHSRSTTGAEK